MQKAPLVFATAALVLTAACDHTESTKSSADILYQNEKESDDYDAAYQLLKKDYNLSHIEIINFIYLAGINSFRDINSINYLESTEKAIRESKEPGKSIKTHFGDPELQPRENLSDEILQAIKELIKQRFPDSHLVTFQIYQNSLGRYYIQYGKSPIRINEELNELLTNHFEAKDKNPNEWELIDSTGNVGGYVDSINLKVRNISN